MQQFPIHEVGHGLMPVKGPRRQGNGTVECMIEDNEGNQGETQNIYHGRHVRA